MWKKIEEKEKEKRKKLSVNGIKELETSYRHFHAFGLNIKTLFSFLFRTQLV